MKRRPGEGIRCCQSTVDRSAQIGNNRHMPILNVEIVINPDEHIRPELAAEIADQAGKIFGSPPGNTWVKVHLIPGENYAENIAASDGIFPVFVWILKARLPSADLLQVEVTQLTSVIAQACNRPQENVHIIYLPEGAGRVAFGGKVLPG